MYTFRAEPFLYEKLQHAEGGGGVPTVVINECILRTLKYLNEGNFFYTVYNGSEVTVTIFLTV
jgi:hypothetical protein